MAGDTGDTQGVTLRAYARVIWRRKWVVIVMTVLLLGLALGKAYTTTPLYQATATLMYETPLDVADPLSGSYTDATTRETEMNAVASVIASPDLGARANRRLGADDIAVGWAVTASPPEATSGAYTGSTVLVTGVSPSAATAARAANAYAAAFTEYRKAQEQEQVRQAQQVIENQIDAFKTVESRQSAEYFTLLQRLQDLDILEATVTGNFRVLVPATTPSAPFSPNPLRNGVMGLAAGLVIGIGLALLLEQFDTRVRTQEEASAIVDMPVIGAIRKLPGKALEAEPLTVLTDPRGLAAEAIRKLRSNLEFADVDGDLKSLVVTSSLQHEGKSLMVCNLALSLAAAGRRVVLVDGDLRRPRVHAYLNLVNLEGVSTVLTGRTELQQALRPVKIGPGLSEPAGPGATARVAAGEALYVLTSGPFPPNPAEVVASRSFAAMIAELRQDYDLVIVDSPAVLAVGDTAAIARCVDGLIFLVDLTRAKRPLLEESARQIGQMPCRKLGLVVISDASGHKYAHQYEYYAESGSPLDPTAGGNGRRNRARTRSASGVEGAQPVPKKVGRRS